MACWADLPRELVDMVLNLLCDDIGTLAACALVTSSWLPTINRHRCRKIVVRVDRESAFAFFELVSSRPDFAKHVHLLDIKAASDATQATTALDPGLLAAVLRHLPKLEELVIGRALIGPFGRHVSAHFDTQALRLLDLRLSYPSSENLSSILSRFSRSPLRNVSFEMEIDENKFDLSFFDLARFGAPWVVRTLTIATTSDILYAAMQRIVVARKLRRLLLNELTRRQAVPGSHCQTFLKNIGPSLRTLDIFVQYAHTTCE